MRKNSLLKRVSALLAVGAGLGAGVIALPAQAEYGLTILHINDVHSRLAPVSKYDSGCSVEDNAEGKCFGGMARIKTAITTRRAELSAEGKNVLTLDAGDQFQGSLFYTTYKGALAVSLMNDIGFDAMAVGNHEFDDGPAYLAEFALAAKFPILFANSNLTGNDKLNGLVHGAVIKDVGGEKVAIIGVLAEDTVETSSPGDTVKFLNVTTALQTYIDDVTARGVNKVIVLSHVGLSRDMKIAAEVNGIDVIVGGHSHTLLSNTEKRAKGPYPTMVAAPDGKNVPIVQAYAYSRYLGELEVMFDDEGNVTSATGDVIPMDASIEEDADIVEKIKQYGAPLEEIKNQVIGESLLAIDGDRTNCRAVECQMGNLVADAILARTMDQGVQLVIQNGGGLRASIDEGPITMGEVLTVLPFQNSIATFDLTGAGVVAALENGLSQLEDGAGRFPQVAGMRYKFDPAAEAGSRVVSVDVKQADGSFAPIDLEASYGVASNNYMRSGGDGYKIFATDGQNAYDFGPGLEEAVAAYVRDNSPYVPYLDGRISKK